MLKYPLTHPGILEVLGRSGHGDRIAVVDGNYPASARRHPSVAFISVNVTHGLVDAPTILRLIGASIPIELLTYPRPAGEVRSGVVRGVHEAFLKTRSEVFPGAEVEIIEPLDFYELTSGAALAVMIGTGERRHYGSAVLTVGYLPEMED